MTPGFGYERAQSEGVVHLVRARRSGAPLWSSSTASRRSRSPSTRPRRPSGSPIRERAHEAVSGVRELSPDLRLPALRQDPAAAYRLVNLE